MLKQKLSEERFRYERQSDKAFKMSKDLTEPSGGRRKNCSTYCSCGSVAVSRTCHLYFSMHRLVTWS